jgi:hypothetical protein
MRLAIICHKCMESHRHSKREYMQSVEIIDSRHYEITCKRDHKIFTTLAEEKFDVLFEIAINAIIDGYYREAISSFAASLERFYEYAIDVILEFSQIQRAATISTWKSVSPSSERQLGAFIYVWLIQFRENPETLSNPKVSFRNKVIHKGHIPTKSEAVAFGDAVAGIILPKAQRIRTDLATAIARINNRDQNIEVPSKSPDITYSAMSIPTFFRFGTWNPPKIYTTDQYIEYVSAERAAAEREKSAPWV